MSSKELVRFMLVNRLIDQRMIHKIGPLLMNVYGVSYSQFCVMHVLHSVGHGTQTDVAAIMDYAHTSVRRHLMTLAKRRLLVKDLGVFALSDTGERLYDIAKDAAANRANQWLGREVRRAYRTLADLEDLELHVRSREFPFYLL